MNRFVCVHGHFYQPPRENPWLEEIELQDSAYPYHDWNEKITASCYGPNTASRILDAKARIIDIVNNFSKISFNVGPTLFSWIEQHSPEVYKAIIEADKQSRDKFSGHGPAIAQVYNHIIMPLANSRDKRTQVLWGIKDFEHRFGRQPEGMWLPETAVDVESLDVMAELGIKFTILAPHQAMRVRKIGEKGWKNVVGAKIDPRMPYSCKLPSGRTISIFFYDGPIAHDVSFGDLTKNGENFAKRLVSTFSEEGNQQLVNIANDGETYGHHFRFGDMALSYCMHYIESKNLAKITVYGEYLEKNPPSHEVEIIGNTSWSCVHGVERWKNDCGCNTGAHPGWNQKWRAPLREAIDWLRDALTPIYEKEMAPLSNPWVARDEYIDVVLDKSPHSVERFLSRNAVYELSKEEKVKILKLLEMQRHALLMYTSCGWFFEEISEIETVQILQYAGRAIQLAKEVSGAELEDTFVKILERAPSNIHQCANGAKVYCMFVEPAIVDLLGVGAHYAISSLFEKYNKTTEIYCYTLNNEVYDLKFLGKQKLAIGKVRVKSNITLEESLVSFAVLYIGDQNLVGGSRAFIGEQEFSGMDQEIKDAFTKGDIPEVIRLMDKHFGTHNYSIRNLLRDEQRKVLGQLLEPRLVELESTYRRIYENNYSMVQMMSELGIPVPKSIIAPMEYIINLDISRLLEKEELDSEYLQKLVDEVEQGKFEPDKLTLGFVASQRINNSIVSLSKKPEDLSLLRTIETLFRILGGLVLELDIWKSQNIFFSLGKQVYNGMIEKAEKGDDIAIKWVELFRKVEGYLKVNVT